MSSASGKSSALASTCALCSSMPRVCAGGPKRLSLGCLEVFGYFLGNASQVLELHFLLGTVLYVIHLRVPSPSTAFLSTYGYHRMPMRGTRYSLGDRSLKFSLVMRTCCSYSVRVYVQATSCTLIVLALDERHYIFPYILDSFSAAVHAPHITCSHIFWTNFLLPHITCPQIFGTHFPLELIPHTSHVRAGGDLLEYLNSFWDRCLPEDECRR